MTPLDGSSSLAKETARALLGRQVTVAQVLGGGRNSRVWCVEGGGHRYALKQYPPRRDDQRDRFTTEIGALRLMEAHGIDTVPRVIAVDQERGFALLSWLEGTAVSDVGARDVDAANGFLAAVHELRQAPEAARQPLAAEACLSGVEIERQIRARLARLSSLPKDEHALHGFLTGAFAEALARALERAAAGRRSASLQFASELAPEQRSLVPSDFGFHNSLRQRDGALVFFDFEYFGWDDPVKLTADFLLHPGTPLEPPQAARVRAAAEQRHGDDPSFAARLDALLPLFGLRWVLILLNEFLPDRWQGRVLAGASEDWHVAKARQLGKARALLARLGSKQGVSAWR